MPIAYRCGHCGHSGVAEDQFAGQSGPCAACGQTMTIPAAEVGMPPSASRKSTAAIVILAISGVAVMAFCVIGILIALLLPAVQSARGAARQVQCSNNMKQIGLALHAYEVTYGSFPPAYTVDEEGRPLHSWRTLILPYLEQQALYDQIDLSEPWDGPNNRRLHHAVIPIYGCPSSPGVMGSTTSYMVVVGEETLFPPGGAQTSMEDLTDGASNTIMLIEVEVGNTHWMEPVDIDYDQMIFRVNGGPGEIASWHPGEASVALADGSVHTLGEGMNPQTLQAMLTRAGGEVVEAW